MLYTLTLNTVLTAKSPSSLQSPFLRAGAFLQRSGPFRFGRLLPRTAAKLSSWGYPSRFPRKHSLPSFHVGSCFLPLSWSTSPHSAKTYFSNVLRQGARELHSNLWQRTSVCFRSVQADYRMLNWKSLSPRILKSSILASSMATDKSNDNNVISELLVFFWQLLRSIPYPWLFCLHE